MRVSRPILALAIGAFMLDAVSAAPVGKSGPCPPLTRRPASGSDD